MMEMCLIGFLFSFSVKIFSQMNPKLEIIKSRFQCFQLKLRTLFWIK